MVAYLSWWIGGAFAGFACGLLVLRRRDALSSRVLAVLAVAMVAMISGAKLQYRLRFFSFADALVFSPSELVAPGFHIPLGSALGFAAAMGMAALLAVPMLDLADALATWAMVMMPIGRVGCLVAGCCKGAVGPTWMEAVCVREAPYEGAALVHSLPVYFALLALALLALDLRLMRRGAKAGTVAAVTFLIHPVGKILLERLRRAASPATPRT